ncbi:MAG: hypothetical protein A2629_00045 [Candidatus Levybacteria bacterium RIFCSPHIGHO2_01_FULL_41_15]|nr:MAG: hypothetical protein A2629_00045 [Candidatus Levybacteria bacterium RIFCSPHIGHO2_01_FULL_41_15]
MKDTFVGLIVWGLIIGGGIWIFSGDSEDSIENYKRFDDPSTKRSYEEYGDRDCGDFSSQAEAQEFFEDEGGPDSDYHDLDRDSDGIACESI